MDSWSLPFVDASLGLTRFVFVIGLAVAILCLIELIRPVGFDHFYRCCFAFVPFATISGALALDAFRTLNRLVARF